LEYLFKKVQRKSRLYKALKVIPKDFREICKQIGTESLEMVKLKFAKSKL